MRVWEKKGIHFPHKLSYGRNSTDRSAEILPEEGSCLSTAINFHFTEKAIQNHLVLLTYPIDLNRLSMEDDSNKIEIICCMLLSRLKSLQGQRILNGYS